MTIRLTIQREAWRQHVEETIASTAHPVPVVKGNGYGLGRARLAGIAADLADTLAVGTVRELNDLPTAIRPVVLTPTLEIPPTDEAILTVGADEHIAALQGWSGDVLVKLESSMHRYGGGIELIDTARAAGLRVLGVSIHPPLAGTNEEHLAEIAAHADRLDDDLEIWISHVDPGAVDRLPSGRTYHVRLGTTLWHGRRDLMHLEARVLDQRPARTGTTAGYRAVAVPSDGHLVMIGAGSANGVATLPDGRSPFHFHQRRLDLLEPPHMHTSMLFVPDGVDCPATGDWVDLQRPLISTTVDEIVWA